MTYLPSRPPLVEAFRRGDERAVEEVYRAYATQVAALLRKGFTFVSAGQTCRLHGIRDPWELECAVQEVFSRALSADARRAYDGVSPFAPYLAAVARNWAISRARSAGREERRRAALAAEGVFAASESPEEKALREELRALVREFRAGLAPELQRFLDVRYGAERNLLEAARELGLSRMRARGRDLKLRRLFARFLERRGYLADAGGGRAPAALLLLGWGAVA